jgi:hypothetical protein
MTDESANPVQEAWERLEAELLELMDGQGSSIDAEDAARALALASAKAMLPPRSHRGAKTGIERRYLALRAQIEGLGR